MQERLAYLLGLAALPSASRSFVRRARAEAMRLEDEPALVSSASTPSLAFLIRAGRGRRVAAEIGTYAGWTALAFAAADKRRIVVSVDPTIHEYRDRYAALVPEVSERVTFHRGYGEEGPPNGISPDFLFIDGPHDRESVIAHFLAWQASLASDAIVAFHDYHPYWPGVIEAVDELGLEGKARGDTFFWKAGDQTNAPHP